MDIKEILIDTIKSQPAHFYIILLLLAIYLVAYFSYLTSSHEAIEERRRELKEILNLAPLFALLALVFLAIGREAWVRNDVFLGSLFVIYVLGVWIFSKHLANHYNSVGRTRFSIPFLSIGLVLVGLPILQTILETFPGIPDISWLFRTGVILCGIFGALNLFLLDQLLKNILMMIPWKTRGVLITTSGIIWFIVSIFWNPGYEVLRLTISIRFVSYCIFLVGIVDLAKNPIYEGILRIFMWIKVHVKIIARVTGTGTGIYLLFLAFFPNLLVTRVSSFLVAKIDELVEPTLKFLVVFSLGIILIVGSNFSFFSRIGLQIYTWFKVNVFIIMKVIGSLLGMFLIWYDLIGKFELWELNGLLGFGGVLFLSGSNYNHVIRFASWSKKSIWLVAFYLKNGLLSFYTWFKVNISTILRVLGSLGGVILIIYGRFLYDGESVYKLLVVVAGGILLSSSNYDHVLRFASWTKNELLAFYYWFSRNFILIMRSLGSFVGLALITYDWFLYEDKPFDNIWLIFGVVLLLISNYNHVLRFASWTKNELLAFYYWFSRNFILIMRSLGSFVGLALIGYDYFGKSDVIINGLLGVVGVILLFSSNYDHVLQFASWTKDELLAFYHWFSRNFVLIMRSLGSFTGLALITYDLFLDKEGEVLDNWLLVAGVILLAVSNYEHVLRFASWIKNKLLAFYHWFSRNFGLIIRVLGSGLGVVLLLLGSLPDAFMDEIQIIFLILGIFLLVVCNYRFIWLLLRTVWTGITKSLTRAARWFIRNRVLIIRVCGSFIGLLFVFFYFDARFIRPIRPKNFEECLCYWFLLFGASTTFPKSLPEIIKELDITVFLLLSILFLILSNINFAWSLILRISYGLRKFARFMAALVARAYSWLGRNKWSILRGVGTFIGLFLIFFGSVEPLTNIELMARFVRPITDLSINHLIYRFSGTVLLILSNFKVSKRIFLKIWELSHRLGLFVWMNIKSFAIWVASWIKKKLISIYHWFSRNFGLILRSLGSFSGLALITYDLIGKSELRDINGLFGVAGGILLLISNYNHVLRFASWTKNELLAFYHWFSRNFLLIIRGFFTFIGLAFIFGGISSLMGYDEFLKSLPGVFSEIHASVFVLVGVFFVILSNLNFTWSLILRISYGLRLFARFMATLFARAFSWLRRNKWSILRGVGTFFGLILFFIGSFELLTDTELMVHISKTITELTTEILKSIHFSSLIYLICGAVLLIASNFKVSKRIFLEIWELLQRLGFVVWKSIKSFASWFGTNIRVIMRVLITGSGVFLQGIGVFYLLYKRIIVIPLFGQRIIVDSTFESFALKVFGAILCIVANPQEFRTLVRAIKNSLLSIWHWIRIEKVLVARTLLILVGVYLVSRWIFPGIPLLQSLDISENEIVTKLDYFLPFAFFFIAFIDYAIKYFIISFKTIRESLKLILAWVKKHFTEIRKLTVTFLVSIIWLDYLVFEKIPTADLSPIIVFGLGLAILILNFARDIVRVIKSFVQALQEALRWMITGFKKLIAFFKEWTVVMGMVLLALVFMGFGGYVIIFQALLVSELSEAWVPISLGLGSIALGVILFWLVNKRRRISPEKGVKG